MAETTKLCARCRVNPRNSSNPSYCKDCYNLYGRESYAKWGREHRRYTEVAAERKCSTCGLVKSASEFYLDDRNSTGLAPQCRACKSKYHQERGREIRLATSANTIIPESKLCLRCGVIKPSGGFYRGKTTTGLESWCKECKNKSNADDFQTRYTSLSPEQKYALCRKIALSRHGLTIEEYARMHTAQDGKCAICGSTESDCCYRPLCVDHNHNDGRVRELLCNKCNPGLGSFSENLERLASAITYLRASRPAIPDMDTLANYRVAYQRGAPEHKAVIQRKHQLKKHYGITLEEYAWRLELQNSKCAICGSANGNRKGYPLFVDHDPSNGLVRGLLCHSCNTGIGLFDHSPDRLLDAIAYLIKHGKVLVTA